MEEKRQHTCARGLSFDVDSASCVSRRPSPGLSHAHLRGQDVMHVGDLCHCERPGERLGLAQDVSSCGRVLSRSRPTGGEPLVTVGVQSGGRTEQAIRATQPSWPRGRRAPDRCGRSDRRPWAAVSSAEGARSLGLQTCTNRCCRLARRARAACPSVSGAAGAGQLRPTSCTSGKERIEREFGLLRQWHPR